MSRTSAEVIVTAANRVREEPLSCSFRFVGSFQTSKTTAGKNSWESSVMHVMRSALPCRKTPNLAASHFSFRVSSVRKALFSKQKAQSQPPTMKPSHPNSLRSLTVFLAFALLIAKTQALYFFLENGVPKCFYEDLPKDTLVVGASAHYDRLSPSLNSTQLNTNGPYLRRKIQSRGLQPQYPHV